MERRRILLGSGVAFTTALAGCTDLMSESGNGNDDDPDGSDDEKNDEKDNGDDGKDDEKDDKDDEYYPIPGLDDLEIDDPDLEITYAKYDGTGVKVGVTIEKDPEDVTKDDFYGYVKKLSDTCGKAIDDREKFEKNVETITFKVYDGDDDVVMKFFLDAEWLLSYVDDDIDLEELAEKAYEKYEDKRDDDHE